jgi:membrane protein implicated in regulation of membrane protease activity
MPAWGWWLLTAAVLTAGEALTVTIVLGLAALGAVAAGVVAALGGDPIAQAGAFCAATVVLIVLVRPIAKRHRKVPAALRTGADALVGAPALVLDRVDRYGGQVRLRGEVWSARLCDGTADAAAEAGAEVRVLAIEGATALVYPAEV